MAHRIKNRRLIEGKEGHKSNGDGKQYKYFKKALRLGLNMGYDEAMAKMSLAGIAMQKNRKQEATKLLQEAKKLDKNGMLTDQLKMMQQQMKKGPQQVRTRYR